MTIFQQVKVLSLFKTALCVVISIFYFANSPAVFAHNKVVVIPLMGDDSPKGPFYPLTSEETPISGYTTTATTAKDKVTGLEWQRTDDGTTMTWEDAMSYCHELQLDSKYDWRLPDRSELLSIIYFGAHAPAVNSIIFTATKSDEYWSASTSARFTHQAMNVDFNSGRSIRHTKLEKYYVRCVR